MLRKRYRFCQFGSFLAVCFFLVLMVMNPGAYALADGNIEDAPAASSLTPELPFENISLDKGLSQVTVSQVLQDSLGFLWIATQDGLNRFDGYTFTVYRPDPANPDSIGHRLITAIAEDKSTGDLWIGTPGGLEHYNRLTAKFTHFTNQPAQPDSLSDNAVSAVCVDSQGKVWVGTSGGGLNRFDPEAGEFEHFVHVAGLASVLSDNAVTSIIEDQAGDIWIGTQMGGVNRYNPATGEFTTYRFRAGASDSLSSDFVTTLYEDREGTIWVGTGGAGLNRFDRQKQNFQRYRVSSRPFSLSHNMVTSIVEDWQGALWVGTYGGGVNMLDRQTGRFTAFRNAPDNSSSLSDNFILSLHVDQGGILWIGTLGNGLNKLNRAPRLFTHISRSSAFSTGQTLGNNLVWDILEDRSRNLWVGTQIGLDRYELTTGRWHYHRHDLANPHSISSSAVVSLELDRSNAIWVGTANSGLDRLDRATNQFVHYRHDANDIHSLAGDSVISLMVDKAGKLWVGTNAGLDLFDPDQDSFIHIRPRLGDPWLEDGHYIFSIFEDENGLLWLGTGGSGLISYAPGSGRSRQYLPSTKDSGVNFIHSAVVFSIHRDRGGIFWLGTNSGLERFDPVSKSFISYQGRDGLPSDVVYGVLEDDRGYLWLSSNSGLVKFEPGVGVVGIYGVDDGLQSREFNSGAYFKNALGEMYFGGVNGFNVFNPERLRLVRPNIPPVVLTDLTQHGAPMPIGQPTETIREITLHWPDNAFEFEFSALAYARPEKNEYAYFLEGFDKGWNYSGNKRYGRYTNLPGGDYTLRLRAANSNGVWNENGGAIHVRVVPPVWQRTWFQGLAILAVVVSVLGAYRIRVKSVEARSRLLEEMVEQRTRTLEERTRELETLYRADEELYRNLNVDQVLQSLLDTAVDTLSANKGALMVWNEKHDRLVARAVHGFDPRNISKLSFASGQGITGIVAVSGEPVIVTEAGADSRATREIVEAENIRSFVQVPIKIGGEVFGVFSVDYTRHHQVTPQEKDLLISLAQRAALAIQNAQLYEQTHEEAVAEERSRLARDLHDAVTQTLFSASLIAEALPAAWESDPHEGRSLLQELRSLSRGALAEMRTLLLELRPSVLVDANMSDLMRQLAEAASGREGIPVTLKMNGVCRLPQDVHIAIYRIAQEAINNVIKHARASSVSISLDCGPAEAEGTLCLTLTVQDDGCGFDPHNIQGDRLGLQNMTERAQAVGARLDIESGPGSGTIVRVQWMLTDPCPENNDPSGVSNVYKIR